MGTTLFMVELRVGVRTGVVAWYVDAIGLEVVLDDPAGDFTLLSGGVAIKGGCASVSPGSAALVFRVDDLDAERGRLAGRGVAVSEVETSAEGYRLVRLSDPAGNPVRLFQWSGSAG